MKKLFTRLFSLFSVSVLLGQLFLAAAATAATGVTVSQQLLNQIGTEHYDVIGPACGPTSGTNPPRTAGGSLYVLGDSITVGMRDFGSLSDKLTATGWQVTDIHAVGGRDLRWGLRELQANRPAIQASQSILVALGTNNLGDVVTGTQNSSGDGSALVPGGKDRVKSLMQDIVNELRATNPTIQIYWTSIFMTGILHTSAYYNMDLAMPQLNQALDEVAAAGNIAILPWGSSQEARQWTTDDGLHPSGYYPEMADYIVAQLGNSGSTPPPVRQSALCECSEEDGSLIGADNQERAFNFFTSRNYTPAQAAGIIGNMLHESGVEPMRLQGTGPGVETPSSTLTSGQLTDTDLGWGIVQWTPPGKMVSAANNDGIDFATIDTLLFQLEVLWRQLEGTGQGSLANINERNAGDRLKETTDPRGAAFAFGRYYERFGGSSDPNNPRYDQRMDSAEEVFNIYADGAAPPGSGISTCAQRGSDLDPNGYAFPLAPQDRTITGITVGQTRTTHWDGTAAFDLMHAGTASEDVYALFGGTIIRMNTNYHDQAGCTTMQLLADDGFYYFYAHMKNPTIQQGDRVTANQKIAEVADRENFNTECWGGGPHLHIDRGCTIDGEPQPGGDDPCRDPEFIPFLSAVYETLPLRRN